MYKLDLERQRNQRSNCQHPLDHQKSKRVPEKHLLLLHSVQSLSHVRLFATPWTAAHQASLSITSSLILPKLMFIESVYHLTISSSVVPFCSCPQSSSASGSFPMSQLFASGGQRIGASTSASVPPSEYSGLISFRIDWLDLFAVKGLLRIFSSTTV